MTTTGSEIPGPLGEWKPPQDYVPGMVKLRGYPKTLYPELHLDSKDTSKEKWGERRKGYPHIEGQYVLSSTNLGATGNCYFMAISTLLYGSKKYWHTVKGHHLQYVDQVLRNKEHPRYDLYTSLNAVWSISPRVEETSKNLWMRLCLPYSWQNGEILQVTADLYDAFIVQFTVKSGKTTKIQEVKVRGNYNATHWMIRFVNDNHFEPLIPDGIPLSEFSFPPITRENTKGKVSMPEGNPKGSAKGATDLNHPWRSPISRQDVPEQLVPRQVLRRLSPLNFSIVAAFNNKKSTIDFKYWHKELERLVANPPPLPPLATVKETVDSKLVENIRKGSLASGDRKRRRVKYVL